MPRIRKQMPLVTVICVGCAQPVQTRNPERRYCDGCLRLVKGAVLTRAAVACQACGKKLGPGEFGGELCLDCAHEQRLRAGKPTQAMPGSMEKIATLAERYQSGLELFNASDRLQCDEVTA